MKQRNQIVDLLKGIGIFVIVWSHISLGWLLDEFVNPIVLCIFFILSGFLYRDQPFIALLKKKSKSLILPFIVFAFVGYIYHWVYATIIEHKAFRWNMLYMDLLQGANYEANIPLWFLISLFLVVMCYHFVIKWHHSHIVFIVISLVGMYLLYHDINYLYLAKTAYYLFFFYFGTIISKCKIILSKTIEVAMSFIIITLVIVKSLISNNLLGDYLLGGITSLFIALMFLSKQNIKVCKYNFFVKPILYMGRHSLVILSFHILAIDFIWRILYPILGIPSLFSSLIYAIGGVLLCVPVIWMYNRICG